MACYPSPKDVALVAFVLTGILCLFPVALSKPSDEWTVAATTTTPVLVQTVYTTNTDDDLHTARQNNSTNVLFAVIHKEMSWDVAFVWCLQRQGRLADVQTRAEMDTLLKAMGPKGKQYYWTGATNHGGMGEFIWTSAGGNPVNKTLFARPGDSGTSGCKDNCIALKTIPNQQGLASRSCTGKFFPICKF